MGPPELLHHHHRSGDLIKEISALQHLLLYPPFKFFFADQVINESIVKLHGRGLSSIS
jgi:hypothetical protein